MRPLLSAYLTAVLALSLGLGRGEETTEVVDGVVEVPETCRKPTFGSRPHFQEPAVLSKTFAI